MMFKFEVTCKSLEKTDCLAQKFIDKTKQDGALVLMFGDVGVGKTAFCKCAAKHLSIKENVTSPSFVILNEYHSGIIPMYHFDLYRLEQEGVKSILNELLEYSQGRVLTFVEWAEYSDILLPKNRIEININYIDETIREFEFKAFDEKNIKMMRDLQNEVTDI